MPNCLFNGYRSSFSSTYFNNTNISSLENSSTIWYSSFTRRVDSESIKFSLGSNNELRIGPTGKPTVTSALGRSSNIFCAIKAAFPPMYFCIKLNLLFKLIINNKNM